MPWKLNIARSHWEKDNRARNWAMDKLAFRNPNIWICKYLLEGNRNAFYIVNESYIFLA